MDDNCVFIFCSMSSETAVTFTGGHFNQAVFAVIPYVLALTAQDHVASQSRMPNGVTYSCARIRRVNLIACYSDADVCMSGMDLQFLSLFTQLPIHVCNMITHHCKVILLL